jgi:hypothetical protein
VDAAEPAHCLRSPAALQDSEPEISGVSESATLTASQGSSRQRFAEALEAHFDAATGGSWVASSDIYGFYLYSTSCALCLLFNVCIPDPALHRRR